MKEETKHTAGEWHAGRADMASIIDDSKGKYIYAGHGPEGKYIGAAIGTDIDEWEEIMANAHLMAASKELLEACQAIEAHLKTTFPPYPEGENPFDKVRAAILKATAKGRG